MTEAFACCRICPRTCGVNRMQGEYGYCRTGSGYLIESICGHKGEEPVISGENGICNVFFANCNMQCLYCQNYQISENRKREGKYITLEAIVAKITELLDSGCESVGFVSPAHFAPQVKIIAEALHQSGRYPIFVYNTNAFERVESLRELEGIIDVYLPDFKYRSGDLAASYSASPDYFEFASQAIKEMYRQKGSKLILNDKGLAESGLIIRHLVLPGSSGDSIKLLRYIADEISVNVHISLMSQYHPVEKIAGHPLLDSVLSDHEYKEVVEELYKSGFTKGWIQDSASRCIFKPDFTKENPFGQNILV